MADENPLRTVSTDDDLARASISCKRWLRPVDDLERHLDGMRNAQFQAARDDPKRVWTWFTEYVWSMKANKYPPKLGYR
ncbi:unnamed protein product [Urochloa humidicola]